jgi:predicted amidophosphoribosyltransferase
MATAIETQPYHDASVKGWKCSECEAEFVYVGGPVYCPECGEEFDSVQSDTTPAK